MTVTFLDRFDIKYAHVPIYAFSRSAITISVGTPYMVDDCKKLPITCTFDHRYFDGMEGLKGLKRLRYYCNNPNQL
jgi:pyruvate/2-oxoglutarate dehydrogenase complex dihydrolipoamide acyltransferase (E2) component